MQDSTTSTTNKMVHLKHHVTNARYCIFSTSQLEAKWNSLERLRRSSYPLTKEIVIVYNLVILLNRGDF
jgi:hypothetical protein